VQSKFETFDVMLAAQFTMFARTISAIQENSIILFTCQRIDKEYFGKLVTKQQGVRQRKCVIV